MLKLPHLWKWYIFFILCLSPHSSWGNYLPHYQVKVKYHPDEKALRGQLLVSFSKEQYPTDGLLFSLPMNRFLEIDPRGPRKILQAPVFELRSFLTIEEDPLYPKGFDIGKTTIISIKNINGQAIQYQIKDNQDVVIGFSTKDGLLHIPSLENLPQSKIIIDFKTTLPNRFLEGLVENELLTVEWHPKLLRFINNRWNTDLMEPSPGIYSVTWESQKEGTLITTTGTHRTKKAIPIKLPTTLRPVKYFPLIFSPNFQPSPLNNSSIKSYHLKTNARRSYLLQQWTIEYINFIKEKYGLIPPWKQLYVVEIRGNSERIQVINNIVLVTTPHYKRTALLDRRVLSFLSQGLGELWFGETVWHNLDHQLWLSRGISTFLSLRFYAYKYGPDAGVFDFIDWMNPHYQEHFIEFMARDIDKELQQPILTPIQSSKSSITGVILRNITYKSALVVSMLEHLIDAKIFRKGLNHFYTENRLKIASAKNFQESMELYYGESLDWFFKQWFHSTQTLDYSISNVSETKLPDGNYQTAVTIEQQDTARMPVDVKLMTNNGISHLKTTKGQEQQEIVIFITNFPFDNVSIDPDEFLLETNRINNHTSTFLRIRPAFDWKKQREFMSLLIPRVGSNAIDGNILALETKNSLGNGFTLTITPGYGSKNNQFLYIINMERKNLNNTTWSLNFSRIGGVQSNGISLNYASSAQENQTSHSTTGEVNQQTVFQTSSSSSGSTPDSGNTNNIALSYAGQTNVKDLYFPKLYIRLEQARPDIGADFNYSLLSTQITHILKTGFRKQISWKWIVGYTEDVSPLQKKYQLGGPQVLRGYPQQTSLSDDQLLASRLDFEFPLVATPWWGDISSLGIQGSIFHDLGKIWGRNQDILLVEQRQDIGIGLIWGVDAMALLQNTFKLEIAYPYNDPDYNKPIFILAGAVSFF